MYVNHRNEEANAVVRKMAKMNKAELPDVLNIVESVSIFKLSKN